MKMRLLIILFLMSNVTLFAQEHGTIKENRHLNSINLGLLGDASIISLNYERHICINSSVVLTTKVGIGYNENFAYCYTWECSFFEEKFIAIPHHITLNIGVRMHFFEFGLGGTAFKGNANRSYHLYPMVGYRILYLDSPNFSLRVFAQYPFTGIETGDILFSPFGFSAGYGF